MPNVAQVHVDKVIPMLLSRGDLTWRIVMDELNVSKIVATRALAAARKQASQIVRESSQGATVDLGEHLKSLIPAHVEATRRLLAIISAKQAEMFDDETGELRELVIGVTKDGEEITATPSVRDIKTLVDSWSKAHEYLERVTDRDVEKKKQVNGSKTQVEGGTHQHIHFHGDSSASLEDRKAKLAAKMAKGA